MRIKFLGKLWATIVCVAFVIGSLIYFIFRHDKKIVDISFMIADLKWDNGKLKILELGEGPQSYFQGFDFHFGKGSIWRDFWTHVKKYNIPIWYVGNQPINGKREQFAFSLFESTNGRWVPSLEALASDHIFQQSISRALTPERFQIKDYQGILVFSNHGHSNWYDKELKVFLKNYPGFLVVNTASTPWVNSKYQTSLLFMNKHLRHYRPGWKLYKKNYHEALAYTIAHDITGEYFVIKPISAANGWGNLMIPKVELDTILKKILTESVADHPDHSFNYWARDTYTNFLVEEYVASHPVIFQNKPYDGTMRVVFIMTYECEKIELTFLGCCWKLPLRSLNEEGSFMDKHKSCKAAARVDLEDQQAVYKELSKLLPIVYQEMLSKYKEK